MTKKIASILIVIIILVGVVLFLINFKDYDFQNIGQNPTTEPAQNPPAGITFPQEGATLVAGQKYTLKWAKGTGKTQIFLVDTALESQGESVAVSDRVYGVTDSGEYDYTIPAKITSGKYKFEIGDMTSGVFSIVAKESLGSVDCVSSDLDSQINLSPGAGNVYGDLAVKNISGKACSISLGNSIEAQYDTNQVKNITVNRMTQPTLGIITLNPNQTVYSQVHFPNGPQCNGPIKTVPVKFAYQISGSSSVTFKNQQGTTIENVNACSNPSDMTQIDIWSFSESKITP